ncbi:hypothetical protein [Brevundimonas sp.]|uniref:hypothetical protein n=1 Tax=Brevundimonas sp. TaxID=1871086 RepID=UPI0025C05838|nr:hypothetical protein [Brevundimonas sp.]
MRIKITGGGIFDGKGQEIAAGKEFDIADPELNEDGSEVAPHPWAGRFEVISGGEKPGNDQPPPEFVAPVGPFTAKEKSPGWWSIFDGADQPVGKAVRKADLDGFDTLSDDDKLEFATASAKAAFDKA